MKNKNLSSHSQKKVTPKISIIVPIYNVEIYLAKCLESIINQTLKEIEILCINDGSTDGSLEIIEYYANKDSRIKIFSDINLGYGHAVNVGIKNATGKYIGIVESDDYIKEDMYEVLYKSAYQEGKWIEIVKSNAIRFYGDAEEEDCKVIPVAASNLYNRIINPIDEVDCFNAYMINTTGIYKRSLFQKYNIQLNESKGAAYQDNGLWFQLFANAITLKFIDQAFYMYRQDRNLSSTNIKTYENAICIFEEWEYIYGILKTYSSDKIEKLKPMFSLRCYGSYYYHFTRVCPEYKLLFIKKFSESINKYIADGIFDISYFKKHKLKEVDEIINQPDLYYYTWLSQNVPEYVDNLSSDYRIKINNLFQNYEITKNQLLKKRETPLISIIVPVYNAEQNITQCLESILSQTLRDFEVICVDDGSTDRSLNILTMYMQLDERIIIFTQNNMGAGVARNVAIQNAKGKYIVFMDSDDFYPNNDVLNILYTNIEKSGLKICGGNCEIHEHGIIKINEKISFVEAKKILYSDWQQEYGYYNFIYERALIVENNIFFPNYRRYQDPPFLIRAMILANEFYAIPEVVYAYRYTLNHVSWTKEKIEDLIKGITECIILSRENQLAELHYESVMRLENSFSERILKYGANDTVLRLLIIAENEIDLNLYNKSMHSIKKTEKNLKIVNQVLAKLTPPPKQPVLVGYVGPNGLKQRLDIKNECDALKINILETTMALSYRVSYLLVKIFNKKNLYRLDWDQVKNLGNSNDFAVNQNEKKELLVILNNIHESKQFKLALKITWKKYKEIKNEKI